MEKEGLLSMLRQAYHADDSEALVHLQQQVIELFDDDNDAVRAMSSWARWDMIPIFSNTLGQEELDAVKRVFESRWLGQGKECEAFEHEFAAHIGVDPNHVLLFNSCTAATFTAIRALGIGEGDSVIVPTIQFVGVANAVFAARASVLFADCDDHTLNIMPSEIERLRRKRVKAVFLLHYGGHPIGPILGWRSKPIKVLGDCANAISSYSRESHVGSLWSGNVFSFDAMKMLVMGDGGALWLGDPDTVQRAKALRYLGLAPKSKSGMDSAATGSGRWWEYDLEAISERYISNDIMAAIGREQLKKLPAFIARRKEIWAMYQEQLAPIIQIRRPPEPLPDCTSSYYLYWIQCGRRDELAAYLYQNGVYTTFRYYPLHLVKYYGYDGPRLVHAEKAANLTLNLPIHQNLTDNDVGRIVWLIDRFFNHKGRLYHG